MLSEEGLRNVIREVMNVCSGGHCIHHKDVHKLIIGNFHENWFQIGENFPRDCFHLHFLPFIKNSSKLIRNSWILPRGEVMLI